MHHSPANIGAFLTSQRQSALTDFLASHNISARQIRDSADERRARVAQDQSETANPDLEPQASSSRRESNQGESSAQGAAEADTDAKKQKQKEKQLEKIKSSKAFKKRKRDDSESDEDALARAIFDERHAPLPGQMENCELCNKRFTVTPYSVAGSNGGLLCVPCGRKVAKEREAGQPKKPKAPRKQTGGIGSRRQVQSRILDGDVGTKNLATLCVQTLAKNVELAESLGDLPEHLVDKIARLFSKRRLLKPDTLPLFVQPTTETVAIYDGARLGEQELISIFQTAPKLRHFKARCAVQFKDEVMDYLLSRDTNLETFYLHGANLLSEDKWHEFLIAKGANLKGLQVYYTDLHVGDETIKMVKTHCPQIKRLKIENNQKLTDEGVKALAGIPSLEHVGLQLLQKTSAKALTHFISAIGGNLQTLSLKIMPDANDTVLDAIHNTCHSLVKLRITDSEKMTDAGFARMFKDWANPPLQILDLQKCRYVNAAAPRTNDDDVGLCSEGFKALMAHSGSHLRDLNIHACRNITAEAFEEAFGNDASYPELRKLEISFCEEVTDFILGSIFRACPNIQEVNVFGCMKVKDVRVPRGVILVGVPNAQGMIVQGDD